MYEKGTKLIRIIPIPQPNSVPVGAVCKIRSYMDSNRVFCEIVSLPASYRPSGPIPKQVGDVILTRIDHWKLHTPKILKARKCQHS